MTQVTNPLPDTLTRSGTTVIARLLAAENTLDGVIRYLQTLATASPAEVAEVRAALDEAIASSEGRHTAVMQEVRKLLDQPPVEFPDLSGLQNATKANTEGVAALQATVAALQGTDGSETAALADRVAALEAAPPPPVPETDLQPLTERIAALEAALGLGAMDGADGGGTMPTLPDSGGLEGDLSADPALNGFGTADGAELLEPVPELVADGLGTPLPADFPARQLLADGGFATTEAVQAATDADLDAVSGIGPATVADIRAYGSTAPDTTADLPATELTDTEVTTNE